MRLFIFLFLVVLSGCTTEAYESIPQARDLISINNKPTPFSRTVSLKENSEDYKFDLDLSSGMSDCNVEVTADKLIVSGSVLPGNSRVIIVLRNSENEHLIGYEFNVGEVWIELEGQEYIRSTSVTTNVPILSKARLLDSENVIPSSLSVKLKKENGDIETVTQKEFDLSIVNDYSGVLLTASEAQSLYKLEDVELVFVYGYEDQEIILHEEKW